MSDIVPEREKQNEWMKSWDAPDVKRPDGERPGPTSERAPHVRSATVDRIARSLGKDPAEVAERYPTDTLRRLKYPVRVTTLPDGTRKYENVTVVAEGVTSLVRK